MRSTVGTLATVEQHTIAGVGPVERMRAGLATLLDDALRLCDAIEHEAGNSREQAIVRTKIDEAVLWLAAATPDLRRRSADVQVLKAGFPSLWSIELSRL